MRAQKLLGAVILIGIVSAFAMPTQAKNSGTRLSATVTTVGNRTSTYYWTIGETANPPTQNVPSGSLRGGVTGSNASVNWTITATKGAAVSGAYFNGQVCVTNTGSEPTQNLAIQDKLSRGPTIFDSTAVSVSAQPVLNPGQTYCYPYSIPVPAAAIMPGATYHDTATATITNKSGHLGTPFGTSARASGVLPTNPIVINGMISVSDTNGKTFTFSSSGSQSYQQVYTCYAPRFSTILTDTATITATGQMAQASASITCAASTVYYGDNAGPQAVSIDLSASVIEGLVPNGSGGYVTYPGSGTSKGTFSIPGLPAGPYLLHVNGYHGNNYIATDSSSLVDLSTSVEGRPDEVALDPSMWTSTTLNATVGNLHPFDPNFTMLELYVPDVNDWVFGLDQFAVSGAPNPGDSSLNLTFNMSAFSCCGPVNLMDGSKGDNVYLTELSPFQSGNSIQYTAVDRILQAAAPVQTAGTNTSLFAAGSNFVDVSTPNSISLTFQTTQFSSALSSGNPNQLTSSCLLQCGALLAVVGLPGTNTLALKATSADLLLLQLPANAPDTNTGTMYYPAFGGGWVQSLIVQFASQVSVTAPGATNQFLFPNGLFMAEDITTASASPIVPTLSAAQNVKINGLDFYSNQSGLGAFPTLTWSAPLIGTPDYYRLDVYNVLGGNMRTVRQLAATLYTKDTSIQLPGLLTPANAFVINLQPVIDSNGAGAPFQGSSPQAQFITTSGVFMP